MANRARKVVIKTAKVSGEVEGKRYLPQVEVSIRIEYPPSIEGKHVAKDLFNLAYIEFIEYMNQQLPEYTTQEN